MTPPYYRAIVASLTRGWSYTATDGDAADGTQPVYLADDLTYEWSFENDLVPGQLDTGTVKFRLFAKSAANLPQLDRGDLVTLDVRVNAAGSRITAPAPFTVAEVLVEVDEELVTDPNVYACTATITAVDALAWLRTVEPQSGFTPAGGSTYPSTMLLWRPVLAQVARQIGRTIACPTTWGEQEGPLYPLRADNGHWQNVTGLSVAWDTNAFDMVAKLLNSHQPPAAIGDGGWTHAIVPGYQSTPSSFPAGYRRVGPDAWWGDNDFQNPGNALVEPQTSLRYYLQPASRKTATTDLPLRFVVTGGILTVEATPPTVGGGHSRGALDAAWCDLPVSLRRSREHRVNDVRVQGIENVYPPGSTSSTTPQPASAIREYTDAADLAASGVPSARNVPTSLFFGENPFGINASFDVQGREHPIVAANYLGDSSQGQSWVYDDFTLWASRIPDTYATQLLTKLSPRAAGETDGDGMVLRHLTLYRTSPAAIPADALAPVSGFIVRGRMRIVDGDIAFTLGLTPGLPVRTAGATSPVTVGEVNAAAYGNTTNANVDPALRVADLDYIDA